MTTEATHTLGLVQLASRNPNDPSSFSNNDENETNDSVEALPSPPLNVLYSKTNAIVVMKPGCLICHSTDHNTSTELPLVQRVRDQLGLRVNLAHRLDRGASGCVLLSSKTEEEAHTTELIEKMRQGKKTYLAWCRGTGEYVKLLGDGEVKEYKGVDGVIYPVEHEEGGWFVVKRPIKNERGNSKEATTRFRFLAGGEESFVVECMPETGRWHQVS